MVLLSAAVIGTRQVEKVLPQEELGGHEPTGGSAFSSRAGGSHTRAGGSHTQAGGGHARAGCHSGSTRPQDGVLGQWDGVGAPACGGNSWCGCSCPWWQLMLWVLLPMVAAHGVGSPARGGSQWQHGSSVAPRGGAQLLGGQGWVALHGVCTPACSPGHPPRPS